jgi:hypothetical protein
MRDIGTPCGHLSSNRADRRGLGSRMSLAVGCAILKKRWVVYNGRERRETMKARVQ